MAIKGLPIWEGFPHTTSVLRATGIERILDYDGAGVPDLTYTEEFIKQCDGIYIKWLNTYGGYSYYLFDPIHLLSSKVTSLGNIQNCWNDRRTATARTHDLGRKSNPSINISAKINWEYMKEVISLVDSSEVYLYSNESGSARYSAKYCSWIKVNVRPGTYQMTNKKHNLTDFRLTLDLPEKYTQKL